MAVICDFAFLFQLQADKYGNIRVFTAALKLSLTPQQELLGIQQVVLEIATTCFSMSSVLETGSFK